MVATEIVLSSRTELNMKNEHCIWALRKFTVSQTVKNCSSSRTKFSAGLYCFKERQLEVNVALYDKSKWNF